VSKPASPFPVLRWIALLWMVVWLPAYVRVWGWSNLLHLCDATVILSCIGVWWGSARLLSSQAVSALLPGVLWLLNLCWRMATGHFLMGGTEYMWDAQYPLWVRLLSFFHVVLPGILLWAVCKLGYDRGGLGLQAAIAAVLLVASRFLSAGLNMNYAYRDPVFNRAWGPPPIHVGVILLGAVVLLYLPTHFILARLFPSRLPLVIGDVRVGDGTV
jgi:hypothetical protein